MSTPFRWAEALARSEAEIARRELVSGAAVHEELRAALAQIEAELSEELLRFNLR